MSMKIKVSYTDDAEAASILNLMKLLLVRFKVKKSTGAPPYKYLYFTPKKQENLENTGIPLNKIF